MKITINKQELDFKITFSKLVKIEAEIGKISEMETWLSELKNASKIASIITGVDEAKIVEMIDSEGSIKPFKTIIEAFAQQVKPFFDPN